MENSDLTQRTLEPLDNLAVVRLYFQEIKRLDELAMSGAETDVRGILELWAPEGELKLTGTDPIGERLYRGQEELFQFYSNRGKGILDYISLQFARVTVANAKSAEQITISGMRYVVNTQGEGMQAPFTHNFYFADGKIQSLTISVGQPSASEIAPVGSLTIEDMGRLAAMAWMVA